MVTDPRSKQVVVEPDFQLITFDFVPEPSNAGAYVVPICKRYRCDPLVNCLAAVGVCAVQRERHTVLGCSDAAHGMPSICWSEGNC